MCTTDRCSSQTGSPRHMHAINHLAYHAVAKKVLISHCRCGQRLLHSHTLSSGRDRVHQCWNFEHPSTLMVLTELLCSCARIFANRQVTCRPPSHQPIFCNSDSGTRQHKVSESYAAAISIRSSIIRIWTHTSTRKSLPVSHT